MQATQSEVKLVQLETLNHFVRNMCNAFDEKVGDDMVSYLETKLPKEVPVNQATRNIVFECVQDLLPGRRTVALNFLKVMFERLERDPVNPVLGVDDDLLSKLLAPLKDQDFELSVDDMLDQVKGFFFQEALEDEFRKGKPLFYSVFLTQLFSKDIQLRKAYSRSSQKDLLEALAICRDKFLGSRVVSPTLFAQEVEGAGSSDNTFHHP